MSDCNEKRSEKRLSYGWPMWFCRENDKEFVQGQMVDVSSTHAAFTYNSQFCPEAKEVLVARVNVPEYTSEDEFEVKDFTRFCTVFRVDRMNPLLRLIVVKFTAPLPFKPGEQEIASQAALEQQFCDF